MDKYYYETKEYKTRIGCRYLVYERGTIKPIACFWNEEKAKLYVDWCNLFLVKENRQAFIKECVSTCL